MTRIAATLIISISGTFWINNPAAAQTAAVQKVETMIDVIQNNKPELSRGREKVFTLTEEEANEYIQHWIEAEQSKAKIKEVTFKAATLRFKPGHVIEADAVAQIGISSLKTLGSESESFVVKKLKQYLSLDNSMQLQCLVSSANGKAFLMIQEAKIKGIALPHSLTQTILRLIGQNQRPPLDFSRLFNLPNGIEKIEILPQTLRLHVKV